MNWLTVKEVFTCYDVHNIPLPMGITTADVAKASEITGCMWGALYNVRALVFIVQIGECVCIVNEFSPI